MRFGGGWGGEGALWNHKHVCVAKQCGNSKDPFSADICSPGASLSARGRERGYIESRHNLKLLMGFKHAGNGGGGADKLSSIFPSLGVLFQDISPPSQCPLPPCSLLSLHSLRGLACRGRSLAGLRPVGWTLACAYAPGAIVPVRTLVGRMARRHRSSDRSYPPLG